MKELGLKELIETSDAICVALTKANVGNVRAEGITLRERLHLELLKFAVYLADANGSINEKEIDIIKEYLKIDTDANKLKQMKVKEKVDDRFGDVVPSVLKYAVLADAGHKLKPDPYNGQKAMVIYDSFKLFGQTILSVHVNDADKLTMSRFTTYVNCMERFIKEYAVWYTGRQKLFRPVTQPVTACESEKEKEEKLEAVMEEFNSLTGLTNVKHQVNSQINLIQVQKMREAQGLKNSGLSKHMVFSGNPGTGKTTVARMLGEIYKYLGILPKGQLIEVDRSDLVRGYIGQTATRVQEVVAEAMGGILFVDEAYTLTVNKGENDFGQEAVETLLKAMEDHRDELIVIVAGYTELMEQFLSSNPGLRSRFNNFIYFDDYNTDEMISILNGMLEKQEYKLSEDAKKKAYSIIDERVKNKPAGFANARDVRNFVEHAIANHASRVVKIKNAKKDKEILSTIEAEDLQEFE